MQHGTAELEIKSCIVLPQLPLVVRFYFLYSFNVYTPHYAAFTVHYGILSQEYHPVY